MAILKNFAVFEGLDGSGTTTQLNMLETFFLEKRQTLPPLYKTYEPTNGSIGELIRLNLRGEIALKPETVALLFTADRNEHVWGPKGIAERCKAGELVVSDRYLFSSLVYQGITCGDDLPVRLNRDFPRPELLIFLDIDPETAQKRMAEREQKEIFEYLEFQIQVRERYKALLPQLSAEGVNVRVINASLPAGEVAAEVWSAIKKMPIFEEMGNRE